jgi:phage terminase small subunit
MKGKDNTLQKELSAKQLAFCEQYIIDLNATQAAIRAGYSQKTANEQSSRLLANVKIQAKIKELRSVISEKSEIDALWVLKRFKEISDRCMQAVPVMVFDHVNKCMVQKEDEDGNGVWEFDSAGANKATEMIGKHIGFFEVDNSQKAAVIRVGYGKDE